MNATVNAVINKATELERRTILHPRFNSALKRLDECYEISVESGKPRSIMVIGGSGLGKSTLLSAFLDKHPRIETRNKTIIPVLSVEIPAQPTIKSTADAILSKFDRMYVSGSAEVKTARIKVLFEQCQVRCLILDEFQHFIDRGRVKMNESVADWIKNLMNSSGICVIAFGLPQSTNLLRYNDQLRRRFSSSITLLPWSLESDADFHEFRGVINAFERIIDMPESSCLHEEGVARRIHFATDGRIGYLAKLLSCAAYHAIKNGDMKVQMEHLHAAFLEEIWADSLEQDNPFSSEFRPRRLNRKSEPFEPSLR